MSNARIHLWLVAAVSVLMISVSGSNCCVPSMLAYASGALDGEYIERIDLVDELSWSAPIGGLSAPPDSTLERVLLYDNTGVARVYPVSQPAGGEEPIIIGAPQTYYSMPENVTYMKQVLFSRTFFFVLGEGRLCELTSGLMDTGVEYDLGFLPEYWSNLWNGYSWYNQQGRVALVLADDHRLFLVAKRPPNPIDPTTRTYLGNLTIDDATIIGNPLVVDGDFYDGSWVIVPTDNGVLGYRLNVTRSELTGYVMDIKFGDRAWKADYVADGVEFDPVESNHMIAFPYPYSAVQEYGKEHVLIGTMDGSLAAFYRTNGTLRFYTKLAVPSIRNLEIESLYVADSHDFFIVGSAGEERSFVAAIDGYTGSVRFNGTACTSVPGDIESEIYAVPGSRVLLFSTDKDEIYILNEIMSKQRIVDLSAALATPVSFLGNIYITNLIVGNFLGVVTEDNELCIVHVQEPTVTIPGEDEIAPSYFWSVVLLVAGIATVVVIVLWYSRLSRTL